MNFFRELDQRTRIRVNADEKLAGVLASVQADKKSIAGSDINNHALAIRRDQILKGASIELIKAFATDDFQHWIILYFPEFTQRGQAATKQGQPRMARINANKKY
jgi:hypothetical protein